jgi:hypothetical protein
MAEEDNDLELPAHEHEEQCTMTILSAQLKNKKSGARR